MIRATYRLQLRTEFGFDTAAAVVPYLARLGVSHVCCSPYLQAAPGSTHGYDVVDHTKISDDLGGPEAHERFVAALEEHGMGHILDVVPNHMAVAGRANQAWWDVLKNGRDSTFARFFDIDWDPPDTRLAGKILLPVLGDQYGRVLEAGELGLAYEDGEAVVTYFDDRFPVAPGSIEQFLGEGTDEQMAARISGDPALLHSLLEAQHYRLAYWRSDLELNYRRFFDINELVALRMEEPEVFAHVHS
ncbi:MAG: alpha-amylase family glycosyl hydrolase, partial [Actinomycetota bacterium]